MKVPKIQLLVLFLSMFIFTLGFGIVIPVVPYFVSSLHGTVFDATLMMSIFSGMELIFAPVWGKVSDRYGRKPVLVIGLAGFALSFALSGLSTSLWMLYATQIFAGILAGGIFPAVMAFIADVTKPEERAGLMGLMGAANGLGMIFGPGLASVFTIWGITAPYFAAAGLGAITVVISLLWMKESRIPGTVQSTEKKASIWSVFGTTLLGFFILMLFVSLMLASVEGTFGYFIKDFFHMEGQNASPVPSILGTLMLTGTNVMGISFTVMGILGVLTQAGLVGKVVAKLGEVKTIALGLVIMAAGCGMIFFISGLFSLIIAACMIMIAISLAMPAINTAVSNRTDEENQGVMMGLLGSFNSCGRVLGPLAGGMVYSINIMLPYIISAALAMVGAIAIQLYARNGKGKKSMEAPLVKDTKV